MRILVVHGYEIYPDGQLSELCVNTCRLVSKIHANYEQIFLLAGQHLKGVDKTVDQAMKAALIQYGVPDVNLTVWSDLCPQQRPPRDTMEEVDLVPRILKKLAYNPRGTTFDVACIWFFRWRVKFLYKNRGAKLKRIYGAFSLDIRRMAIELIAFLLTRWAPDGQHNIIQKNRADRNVFPTQPDGQPWIDNVPSAWD